MEASQSRRAWVAVNGTVFVASFCVMVVELVAGRIISRHLGASIYTWTSVIGVVLGGLAIGNYTGGRLADRYVARPTLSLLFLLSSVTCVAIIVADNIVGAWDLLWDFPWPLRVASHVTLVFWLPAALLGTIGPVAAKMALDLGRKTGRTLGNVYAWGVVGSIAGTFATGYIFLDLLDTAVIVWSVAGVLALMALLYMPLSARGWGWSAVLAGACLLANAGWEWTRAAGEKLALRESTGPHVLYEDESLYSHIEVRALSDTSDLRGLYLDKLLHSQISMNDPLRQHYGYVKLFSVLTRAIAGDVAKIDSLTIGGGGYVFPRFLETEWPAGRTEVVEIDPAVTLAAREAFGFPAETRIVTHHEDGRVHVNRLAERQQRGQAVEPFDFVYLDAVNDYSVPFQLTTAEFFGKVKGLMTSRGALMVNCIDILDSGRLTGALYNTLRSVFTHVAVFTEEGYERMRGDSRLTFVLVASARPPPDPSLAGIAALDEERLESYVARSGRLVLRDGYAPVEALLAPVVRASSQEVASTESLARALHRAERGDLEGYVRGCEEALARDPQFAEARYNLGVGLHRLGRVAEAIDQWRKVVRSRPEHVEARYNLGAALYAEGDLEGALGHLSEATRLRPGLAQAQNALGVVLEARGEAEMASRRYAEALRLDPGLADARQGLIRVGRSAAETPR